MPLAAALRISVVGMSLILHVGRWIMLPFSTVNSSADVSAFAPRRNATTWRVKLVVSFLGAVAFIAAGCTVNMGIPIEVVVPGEPSMMEASLAYSDACASCHGIDGKGNGPVAVALISAPTDLTRLSEHNRGVFPRELVVRTLRGENAIAAHGPREMPVWNVRFGLAGSGAAAIGSLYAARQLEMIVDYVEALQRKLD